MAKSPVRSFVPVPTWRAPSARSRIAGLVLLGQALVTWAALAVQPVPWTRTDHGCSGRAKNILRCGRFGTYHFGAGRSGPCAAAASGLAEPLLLDLDLDSDENPRQPPQAAPERPPHIALTGIVDWHRGSHGLWVWVVIDGATAYEVLPQFKFLDNPRIDPIAAIGEASDLHVLEQLCSLANQPILLPRIVNLSFGRLLSEPPCTSGDSIPCEISRVLAHLRDERDVLLVASAGNHGELLFPASDPSTLAVGMLDTESFWNDGRIEPRPTTPAGFDALVPGNGLVVEAHPDAQAQAEAIGLHILPFVVPPGSSFATAFLTGWLSAWEIKQRGAIDFLLDDHTEGLLSIYAAPDGFYLTVDGKPQLSSRIDSIDRMLETVFGLNGGLFEEARYDDGPFEVAVRAAPVELQLPLSRQRLTFETNLPNPGSQPCLPCRARRRGGRASAQSTGRSSDSLELTLEVASASVRPGGRLDEVLLRLGDDFYEIGGGDYRAMVDAIALGSDSTVHLDLSGIDPRGQPMSLLLLYTRLFDDEPFWDEVPVLLHLARRERLFGHGFESGEIDFWGATRGVR